MEESSEIIVDYVFQTVFNAFVINGFAICAIYNIYLDKFFLFAFVI